MAADASRTQMYGKSSWTGMGTSLGGRTASLGARRPGRLVRKRPRRRGERGVARPLGRHGAVGARRHARELPEVAGEVRLVVEAAALGQLGPARVPGQRSAPQYGLEAPHARIELGRQPDRVLEARGEVAPAEAARAPGGVHA